MAQSLIRQSGGAGDLAYDLDRMRVGFFPLHHDGAFHVVVCNIYVNMLFTFKRNTFYFIPYANASRLIICFCCFFTQLFWISGGYHDSVSVT